MSYGGGYGSRGGGGRGGGYGGGYGDRDRGGYSNGYVFFVLNSIATIVSLVPQGLSRHL